MHRIRLASQWHRETFVATSLPTDAPLLETAVNTVASPVGISLVRSFHAPTGLTPTDRLFLTGSLAHCCQFPPTELNIDFNEYLSRATVTDARFMIDVTDHLQGFNRLKIMLLAGSASVPNPAPPSPWPLENLALEIHPASESD